MHKFINFYDLVMFNSSVKKKTPDGVIDIYILLSKINLGGVADFEVGLRILGTHRVSIIPIIYAAKSVQPFLNGTKIIILLQYVEKSCRRWVVYVVSPSGSFLWFPQVGRFCGFPKKKKGFSGQPVTVAEIFLGDYGYPMGTLNSQTNLKIGDASLKGRFSEFFSLIHPRV